MKKALKIVGNVILWLFVAFAAITMVFSLSAAANNKYRIYRSVPVKLYYLLGCSISHFIYNRFRIFKYLLCRNFLCKSHYILELNNPFFFITCFNFNLLSSIKINKISLCNNFCYFITGKSEEQLRDFCKQAGIEIDETWGKGKIIDEIFGEKCEGSFIQPTFIIDYPIEMSPLTKRHRDNPELTERFELMVNGKELANAYSELNDPVDQYERFVEQMRLADKGDDEAMIIDHDFIRALEYGMPPTSGMGIGMDRLAMLMTGQTAIQEVLLFPQMRPEKTQKKEEENPEEEQTQG